MKEIGGKPAYVPFRVLTAQPSLVEGGEMKDYQVRIVPLNRGAYLTPWL
jgi:SWI/SNF-related matrix-associated actin-dependent regulator of chromatin subfamily A member 5